MVEMRIIIPLVLVLAAMLASSPARAHSITGEQVRAALQQVWPEMTVHEVRLPGAVTSRMPEPQLVADRLQFSQRNHELTARLRCQPASVCRPFWVHALVETEEGLLLAKTAAPAPRAYATPKPVLVKRGDKVWLRLTRGDARVTMPAVSLGSGARGEQVRVRLADRRVLAAAVVERGLLEGNY